MLQRLSITLVQLKPSNTSENLLNEIRQIIYSLYRAKEVAKKVYNNIMNSIKLFMKSKNSKTFDPDRLFLNLSGKIDLKRSDKYIVLSNLSIYYTCKNIKESYKNNRFKISFPKWNKKLELPDGSNSVSDIQDYFEYIIKNQTFKIKISKYTIKIYINKIEKRITLKIKKAFYLQLLRPEMMNLLGSIKNKITKDENGENVHHLEIAEVALVHCNIVSNDFQQDPSVLYTFVRYKSFGQLLDISPK